MDPRDFVARSKATCYVQAAPCKPRGSGAATFPILTPVPCGLRSSGARIKMLPKSHRGSTYSSLR